MQSGLRHKLSLNKRAAAVRAIDDAQTHTCLAVHYAIHQFYFAIISWCAPTARSRASARLCVTDADRDET
jgi:hypothetical protein